MARRRFNGVIATLAGLAGGAIGLSVALFLRSLIENTPAEVQPTTVYWWFVLLTAAGGLWGVATQTMKQLEQIQGYPKASSWRGPGRSARERPAARDEPVAGSGDFNPDPDRGSDSDPDRHTPG